VLTLSLVVLGVCAFVALSFLRPVVLVTEAVEGPVVEAFYSTGTVQPVREYPIRANLAGVMTDVKVDKGDRVKAGDVLAVVSEPEMDFLKRKAEAELTEKTQRAEPSTSPVLKEFDARITAASDLLEISQREQKRVTRMLEANAASQTDLDRAIDRFKNSWVEFESLKSMRESKKLELQKDLDVARAALAIASSNFDRQTLRSPIDGVVLDRPTSVGTRLAINDHLMQIADVAPEKLVMRAAVDEEDKVKVHLDQTVKMTLYSFPGQVFTGRVTKIYDKADPDRRTFEVDVRVTEGAGRENLAAGMTGELAFVVAEKSSAVVIPSQAVQAGRVMVVRDGVLRTVPDLKFGLRSVERVEIAAGVRAGERVVVSPLDGMSDGRRVRVSFIDATTAANANSSPDKSGSFKGFKTGM